MAAGQRPGGRTAIQVPETLGAVDDCAPFRTKMQQTSLNYGVKG